MTVGILLISKLLLIFFLWIIIIGCIFFILNSPKIYKRLKHYEELCIKKKKEAIYHLVPFMIDCARLNKNLRTALNINNIPKTDLLYPIALLAFRVLGFLETIKLGFALTKRLTK